MPQKRISWYRQQARNPFRPPDWRWQRANDLVTAGRYYSRKCDDEETGVAVHYLRQQRRAVTRHAREVILQTFAYVSEAEAIRNRPTLQRLELEARILAGQSDVAAGDAMGAFAPTVQAYQDLFLDVRRCLKAPIFMIDSVLTPERAAEPPEWRYARWDAWQFGPAVVSLWLHYLRSDGIVGPRLTKLQKRTIELRIAHHQLRGDEQITPNALQHLGMLSERQHSSRFPQTISSGITEWVTSCLKTVPLPREELRRCAYAPSPFLRRSPPKSHSLTNHLQTVPVGGRNMADSTSVPLELCTT